MPREEVFSKDTLIFRNAAQTHCYEFLSPTEISVSIS
jgi:hypothetical protein